MKPTNEGDVINQGAPLRVKFSNVREKIKVLQASRNASQTLKDERISIIEDFTDKVRENENIHLQGSYRVAHFPVFQFPVGKREIWPISRSGKTGKSGKIVVLEKYYE